MFSHFRICFVGYALSFTIKSISKYYLSFSFPMWMKIVFPFAKNLEYFEVNIVCISLSNLMQLEYFDRTDSIYQNSTILHSWTCKYGSNRQKCINMPKMVGLRPNYFCFSVNVKQQNRKTRPTLNFLPHVVIIFKNMFSYKQ